MTPEHRKIEIINEALVTRANELEQAVAYWKAETEKAWATAKKWKEEEEAKGADTREELEELCTAIEEIGALIPLTGGGTMGRDPCDAILYQVKLMLTQPAPEPAPAPVSASA